MRSNSLRRSTLTALITLSAASVYYAQTVKDTVSKEADIEQVVLTGVADLAKDRKTPVAVSTIKEAQIIEKLGNQEFPEILNTTPSVYATKGGGGFGDSKLNIRGFAQENIAVMINGVPVNDMENGSVYWSNWAGLSDVTSAMQVQRGLGSSKLAIASVGGTVNILTRSADRKEGGKFFLGTGNDGYNKQLFAYNTGKGQTGWSSSFLLSRTAGSTYASGTDFEGYNYYFALGYQPNEKHDFQFTMTGAPQYHNQRFYNIKLQTLIDRGSVERPDRRYNSDEGILNGKEFSFKRNYYHKPVMSLNWDWKISPASKLSSVAYGSFGRGAGTSDYGGVNGNKRGRDDFWKNADGLVNFDAIVAANQASTADKGTLVRATSVNSHNWFGLISTFNNKINDNLNFSVGVDSRYYYGYHYYVITDLLGASAYKDSKNLNLTGPNYVSATHSAKPSFNPFGGKIDPIEDRINFSNDGEVLYYGGFGQIEYSNDKISAFAQGSISQQGYQRIDNFIVDGQTTLNGKLISGTNQSSASNPLLYTKTGFKNLVGYNVKGGVNYNIDERNNVFVNAGYYSKQPFIKAVYQNNKNYLNPNVANEKIFGLEAGYGFRASWLNVNLNGYRTTWKDQYVRGRVNSIKKADGTFVPNPYANIEGVEEIHQGVEFEANSKINNWLTLTGMVSVADWHYKGNASGSIYDESNNPIDKNGEPVSSGNAAVQTLYLDKIKVGDAAQMTAALGLELTPIKDLRISANYRYLDNLYARLNVVDFANEAKAEKGALQLPGYGLIDMGIGYKINLPNPKQSLNLRANVYNLLDTYYLQESYTNNFAGESKATNIDYRGVDTSNEVFFGFGTTWSFNVAFNF